jgi:hypothetical protein
MRVHSSTRFAAIALLLGALACGGRSEPETDVEPDQAAAARDTMTTDTLGGEAQNPPGYRGMERDTTISPSAQQTPSDTFLQNQGQGQPQDTAGYTGMERVDTTGQAGQDTTGFGTDTTQVNQGTPSDTGAAGVSDTLGAYGDTTGQMGADTLGDTTGYNPSQESQDTTTAR